MYINYKVLTDLDQPLFHDSRKEFLTSASITGAEQAFPGGFLVRNKENQLFAYLGTKCNTV